MGTHHKYNPIWFMRTNVGRGLAPGMAVEPCIYVIWLMNVKITTSPVGRDDPGAPYACTYHLHNAIWSIITKILYRLQTRSAPSARGCLGQAPGPHCCAAATLLRGIWQHGAGTDFEDELSISRGW